MTRAQLAVHLLDLPTALKAAEEALLEATTAHVQAKLALEVREAAALIQGIEGGNAEVRKARLTMITMPDVEEVADRAAEKERAAAHLRCVQAEAAILRACALLMGDDDA